MPACSDAAAARKRALDLVGLGARASARAGELTLGERRRLEVARALAMEPRIVLLDEVMAGLNQTEVGEIIALVQTSTRPATPSSSSSTTSRSCAASPAGCSCSIAALLAEGTAEEVLENAGVVEAYVGKRRA